MWTENHDKAFNEVKSVISDSPCLAFFDPNLKTKVSSDASKIGLGACLYQQQQDGEWRLVFCASRSLTSTEQNYAPIEREALGVTWACDTFAHLLIGLKFEIETDHKPLVALLGQKDLNELPPRIQRFRIRLMRYNFSIKHFPGKELIVPDTLSRAPCKTNPSQESSVLLKEVESYARYVVSEVAVILLCKMQWEQQNDVICSKLIEYCKSGWPDKLSLSGVLKVYYPFRAEINYIDGILMRGTRIIVPCSMRLEILDKLHEGHQGIGKCRERAKASVWWPGLSNQISDLVHKCTACIHNSQEVREPMIPSDFPYRPWEKIGADLFSLHGTTYLVVVDYYSRFIEIAKLDHLKTRSFDVILHLKSIFARHGVPDILRSDNGPQFSSWEFTKFAKDYGFDHVTSSPLYSQANGEVERAVKTVKGLLKKSGDPYLSLMAYRATPVGNGYSPAELLFGRRLKTTIPTAPSLLTPTLPDQRKLRAHEEKYRQKYKLGYDKRHRVVQSVPELKPGTQVFVRDSQTHGIIQRKLNEPRSYEVLTPRQTLRRNRKYLVNCEHETGECTLPEGVNDYLLDLAEGSAKEERENFKTKDTDQVKDNIKGAVPAPYDTRYGRQVKPVRRLDM